MFLFLLNFSYITYIIQNRNVFKWMFFIYSMLKIKKMSEVIGKRVYTDGGDLFGVVEELNLLDNKVDGWRIVVSRESGMSALLGGARGIIVPQQFIKAVGDILLISKAAVPVKEEEDIDLDEVEA